MPTPESAGNDPTARGPAGSATEGRPAEEVRERRQGDELAASKYELFLSVAGDLDRVGTAYDAELVVSTMLGAAYAIAGGDRAAVLAETTEGLSRHLAGRGGHHAALLRAVLATHETEPHEAEPHETDSHETEPHMAEPHEAESHEHETETHREERHDAETRETASADSAAEGVAEPDRPGWLGQLSTVRPTGTHAFRDRQGVQITYLASFAYGDPDVGGPEHVVAAVVDHELGHVRDLFVAAPAGALLGQLEAAAATDEKLQLVEVDPGELRESVERYLDATDRLAELPEARSLTSDRALAAQRLRLLPEPDEQLTVADFLGAPEAARLKRSDEESLNFALKLISGFASEDPLRWNPTVVEEFLLEWLPARALLDRADIELIPTVLSAWVRWAGRMSGSTPRDVAKNVAAVATGRAEFAKRARSGSHRSEAAKAMIEMLRDGIDINDEDAVARWLADYNLRSDDQAE